jgi:tripartite motif-containing protein 71
MKVQILVVSFVAACLLVSCTGNPLPPPSPATSPAPSAEPTEVPTVVVTPTAVALKSPVEFVSKIIGDPNPLKNPLGVATDQQGDLYVVDAGNSRIQEFDSSGKFLRMWGSRGTGDGQFYFGSAIAGGGVVVDHQGNVYVGDYSNRVQKFDSQGKFIRSWKTTGHGEAPSLVYAELYLAVDAQNNVYVADFQNDRIEKFDADGKFLLQWGGTSSGDAELFGPEVATDPNGNVYVAEFRNGRVQRFDGNGKVLAKFFLPFVQGLAVIPHDLAVDSQGNIYFLDAANSRVVKFDPNGTPIGVWGEPGTGNGQFNDTPGVALDGQGNIYISDLQNNCVQKFKPKSN